MNKRSVKTIQEYPFVTPRHVRAARAYLGWNLYKMQEKSGLALDTISRYERGAKGVLPKTVAIMYRTFEREGVELVPDGLRAKDMQR
jgi:transcriptional regulator with XRE-family HTH domain